MAMDSLPKVASHNQSANRLGKDELLKLHNAQVERQQAAEERTGGNGPRSVKRPDLKNTYPASTKPIRELEKIPLRLLRPDTHHRGQAIIVRTVGLPYAGAGTVTVVQDEHGDADKLVVYAHSDSSILSNIPEGCFVAVKEPFYRRGGGGEDDMLISVDHPSDILLLKFGDPIIPAELKQGDSAGQPHLVLSSLEEWRTAGDTAFLQRDLATAVFCYTEALDFAISVRPDLKASILAKRAGTNLMLGRYDAAKEDALASVAGPTTQTVGTTGGARVAGVAADWKAYSTASKAAYALGNFRSALDLVESALKLNPTAPALLKELERTQARVREEDGGEYDFPSLAATLSRTNVHLGVANFTRRTVVRSSQKHGNGLFAAEDIKAGEIVFVEKATVMPNQYDEDKTSAALYVTMVRRLYDNPTLARRLATLWAGGYTGSGKEGTVVDGSPVVDVFHTELVRVKNCFSCPLTTLENIRPLDRKNKNGDRNRNRDSEAAQAKGIWAHAAAMNHSCVSNSTRSFMGDVLITRATRDITTGEEVTQQYVPVKADREGRQVQFREWWGFECSCALCAAEKTSADDQYRRRRALLTQIEKITNKTARSFEKAEEEEVKAAEGVLSQLLPLPLPKVVPDATIRNIERLARQLEEAHEEDIYGKAEAVGLPRLMLVFPSIWLIEAHRVRKNHTKVIEYALKLLRNFGFSIPKGQAPEEGADEGDVYGEARKIAKKEKKKEKKRQKKRENGRENGSEKEKEGMEREAQRDDDPVDGLVDRVGDLTATASDGPEGVGGQETGSTDSMATIFQAQPQSGTALMTIHAVRVLKYGADAYGALGRTRKADEWETAARFGFMVITGWDNDLAVLVGGPGTPG